jgi:hypothetical protein
LKESIHAGNGCDQDIDSVLGRENVGRVSMSDRVKLTAASLIVLMLPFGLGFSLRVLIMAAIMATGLDLAKERFRQMQVSHNFMAVLFWFLR